MLLPGAFPPEREGPGSANDEPPAGPPNVRWTYHFIRQSACPMCGADLSDSRMHGLRLNRSQGLNPRRKPGIAVSILRCRNCGLLFPDPVPVPDRLEDHYGMPPETYWQGATLDPEPGTFRREIETVRQLLPGCQMIRALDIGMGVGKAARVMRDAGFDVSGLEPSRPFFERAIRYLGDDPVRFQHATFETARFPETSFNFVTFGAVLEHLHDPDAALVQALRWLQPGGIMHAEVPNATYLVARLLNLWFRFVGTTFVSNVSPMHPPFHITEFTERSFRLHGARRGYALVHSWLDVGRDPNLPAGLDPLLRTVMAHTGTGMQLTVFLRKHGAP